jgi:hypothetical protein
MRTCRKCSSWRRTDKFRLVGPAIHHSFFANWLASSDKELFRVPKRFPLLAIFFAWLLATGAQWDFLQVAGWSRMLFENSQRMSLSQAIDTTFSGQMCAICKAVNQAKQRQNATLPNEKEFSKFVLIYQPTPSLFFAPVEGLFWSFHDQTALSALRAAPPAPPPRAVTA